MRNLSRAHLQPLDIVDPESGVSAEAGLPKVIAHMGQLSASIRAQSRCIRRRLPSNSESQPLCFPPGLSVRLDLALHKLVICARCVYATTKSTAQMVATQMVCFLLHCVFTTFICYTHNRYIYAL